MPALIDLRRRIRSVRNTQQITQAMKTVSTAKFRKAQKTILEARPWWHGSPQLLSRLASWAGPHAHPILERRQEKKVTGLVITTDKGLCGAFNSNLLARAHEFFEEKAKSAEVRLFVLGKKAVAFFKKLPYAVDYAVGDKTDKLTVEDLRGIGRELASLYAFQRTDSVTIVYNEFKSFLAPRLTVLPLLPFPLPEKEEAEPSGWTPAWEPEAAAILGSLLSLYVEDQVRHCYFESSAAEHAARMMAMDNATKNAEELISDLVLVLNKIRQGSITKELLEIMTAVEALAK